MSESIHATIRTRERATTRTARYVIVGAEPVKARRIWFALHGYGMLAARFVRPFEGIVPDDTCIIAPEALSRFYLEMPRADGGHMQRIGATWLTRESRETEIADAHRWLDAVHDEIVSESTGALGCAPAVGVLGFSQGVATAMRWIANGRVAPQQFVVWAGGLAHDADHARFVAKLQHAEMLLVTGDDDQFATEAHRTATLAALNALGVRYRTQSFEGTHVLDTPLLKQILHDFARSA